MRSKALADQEKAKRVLVSAGQLTGVVILVVVTLFALYLAVVLLLTLVVAVPDGRIIGATTLFIVVAVGAPAFIGRRLRKRGWSWRGAIAVAALICLGACLCVAPVELAALAM